MGTEQLREVEKERGKGRIHRGWKDSTDWTAEHTGAAPRHKHMTAHTRRGRESECERERRYTPKK